jgi:uncharacterized membrane protein
VFSELGPLCMVCGWGREDQPMCDVASIDRGNALNDEAHAVVAVLCPNCHRQLEFGVLAAETIQTIISDRKAQTSLARRKRAASASRSR